MKLVLICLLLLIFMVMIFLFFYRIGQPIDATISKSYYNHAWKSKIVYAPMGNWFELDYEELNADIKGFQVLTDDFAKDNTSVFFKGRKQVADAPSFYIDQSQIPKDKNYVYTFADIGLAIEIVKGADPDTYVRIEEQNENYYDPLYKDNSNYFFNGEKLEVDYHSFMRLNETIFIDHQFIYILSKRKSNVLAHSTLVKKGIRPAGVARSINKNYAQIGSTIFLSNWKNDFAFQSFTTEDSIGIIDERNLSVGSQLLSDGILVRGVDVATLQIIDRDYMRDKTAVFYNGQQIPSADATSFEVLFEEYSKDANRVYFSGKELVGAKPLKFKYDYASQTASDGITTYKDGVQIKK